MNKRIFSIVLALGLVVSGVLAGPATAAKKKKPKKPAACKPYVAGEMGAEKPTVVVTDAHTAEAPLVQKVNLDMSLGDARLLSQIPETGPLAASRDYFNVQVDTKLPSAGLYVTFEFDEYRDYDLWAYFSDGMGAASSHGFQPLIDTKGQSVAGFDPSNTTTNHGGESTATSENLVGIITPDCGGYTIETANWLGEGGEFEIKVWLGEGKTEPGVPE
ncbi:MAG: hypothetical protein M3279_02465 [Actinomycetota bacterium]|nr:hypothetical protein [Actinomycetota bacterium]